MEVATFVDNVSQFEPDESNSMCVAFASAQIILMVPPNQTNPSSPEDIDQLADQIYDSVTGSITQPIPIAVDQLKGILSSYNISFQDIGTDTNSIDAALESGCPVIIQGPESSIHDMTGASPYLWDTTGLNHCLIASGLSDDGGYDVRDSANGSGNPAVYQKDMDLYSAIQVFPSWISN